MDDTPFAQAAGIFLQWVDNPAEPPGGPPPGLGAIVDWVGECEAEALQVWLDKMAGPIDRGHDARASEAIRLVGQMVRHGADGTALLEPLLDRLLQQGQAALRYVEEVRALGLDDLDQVPEADFERLLSQAPGPTGAFISLDGTAAGVTELLAHAPSLRQRFRERAALMAMLRELSLDHPGMWNLRVQATMADGPLDVLEPSTGRGWRFRLAHVETCFQLLSLLQKALLAESPGPASFVSNGPPHESWCQYSPWRALRPGSSGEPAVAAEPELRGESPASSIPRFEGRYLLLLSPATGRTREWDSDFELPSFEENVPSCELVESVSAAEVPGVLSSMLAAVDGEG